MGDNATLTARCWIAGGWQDGNGAEITRRNPFNDELVTSVHAAMLTRADAAIAAARAARRTTWRSSKAGA